MEKLMIWKLDFGSYLGEIGVQANLWIMALTQAVKLDKLYVASCRSVPPTKTI
jgi:hypothetical protein